MLQLYPQLMQRVIHLGAQRVLTSIEMPLASQLSKMELTGISVSVRETERVARVLREQIAELERAAERLVEHPFNMASPEQVLHSQESGILFAQRIYL